ncbi:MAG: hypothetical protein HC860_13590 [Alkalinema sp. RU_4_3]|nr:hypothetical protein [Alkalinema sp. RU_4_3]
MKTIDDRLKATQTRIDQQRRGKWKTWVQPNPIGIVANILGGGDAQRVELAIGDLELQVGELQRRRSQVEAQVHEQVLGLVLEVERGDRSIKEMQVAQAGNAQRLAVMEVGYKFGRGSTVEMMGLWQAAEAEKGRLKEAVLGREQVVMKLAGVTGHDYQMVASDRDSGFGGAVFAATAAGR